MHVSYKFMNLIKTLSTKKYILQGAFKHSIKIIAEQQLQKKNVTLFTISK